MLTIFIVRNVFPLKLYMIFNASSSVVIHEIEILIGQSLPIVANINTFFKTHCCLSWSEIDTFVWQSSCASELPVM